MYHPNGKRGARRWRKAIQPRTGVHFVREIFIESDIPELLARSTSFYERTFGPLGNYGGSCLPAVLLATSNRTTTRARSFSAGTRIVLGSNPRSLGLSQWSNSFSLCPFPRAISSLSRPFVAAETFTLERDTPLNDSDNPPPPTNWIKQVNVVGFYGDVLFVREGDLIRTDYFANRKLSFLGISR